MMSGNLTELYPGGFIPKKKEVEHHVPHHIQFLDALTGSGFRPKNNDVPEGQICRCDAPDAKTGSFTGWCLYFGSDPVTGISGGIWGDWRLGNSYQHYWSSKQDSDMSDAEQIAYRARLDAARKKAADERQKRQDSAANEAATLISGLPYAATHPYLSRKKVKPYGAYVDGDVLIIPRRNVQGEIRSFQRIFPNGDKRYQAGGETKGTFHLIGSAFTEPTYLAEGYATAATIHEATGKAVVVAFDAGNLAPVVAAIREGNQCQLVICADNDRKTEGNPGVDAAKKAAEGQFGVRVVVPEFKGTDGTDFNDLSTEQGIEVVRWQILGDKLASAVRKIAYQKTTAYRPPVPTEWILDDYLVEGTVALLFGGAGIAKSFLVQDVGMCIATGNPWHGREVKQGAVFYLAGEGHQDLHTRIDAWKSVHGIPKEEEPPFYNSEHGIDIRDPEWIAELCLLMDDIGERFSCLIVDTLSTNFGGGDENSGDMEQFITALTRLAKERSMAIIVVHHIGKDKDKGARGHSSQRGNVYTSLPVDKVEHDGAELTRLNMDKQKGGPELKPLAFKMNVVDMGTATDSRGRVLPVTSLVPELILDANTGADAAAALIDRHAKKKSPVTGPNQRKILTELRRYIKQVKANNPAIEQPTIDRQSFKKLFKNAGIDPDRSSEYFSDFEKKGILKNGSDIEREIHISD
ncbi:MAG: AAA family ATPase [Spongiibacteraceae bacterium]